MPAAVRHDGAARGHSTFPAVRDGYRCPKIGTVNQFLRIAEVTVTQRLFAVLRMAQGLARLRLLHRDA